MASTIVLQPLSAYTFTTKEAQMEEDMSVTARLQRLQSNYEDFGMRRTVEGVLLVHDHGHPHVLMLQIGNAFCKLPGDYLQPGEDEVEGLRKRLDERLAPDPDPDEPSDAADAADAADTADAPSSDRGKIDWEVGDILCQWWRPAFETFMYPYIPPHITKPKECKRLYLINMPNNKVLAAPNNMKLLAVPLFELYDNSVRYGSQLAAIPHFLSRYNFVFA